MDIHRQELDPDGQRTGWRHYLDVGASLLPLWWVPVLVIVVVVLAMKTLW